MAELSYDKGKTCAVCGETAIVGYGNPPKWLCELDFSQALRETKAALDLVRQLASSG